LFWNFTILGFVFGLYLWLSCHPNLLQVDCFQCQQQTCKSVICLLCRNANIWIRKTINGLFFFLLCSYLVYFWLLSTCFSSLVRVSKRKISFIMDRLVINQSINQSVSPSVHQSVINKKLKISEDLIIFIIRGKRFFMIMLHPSDWIIYCFKSNATITFFCFFF